MSYRTELLSDFKLFVQTFFELKTHRKFQWSYPPSFESHFATVIKELYDVFLLKTTRLVINMPPGWGKSQLIKMFISWATAHYPDSNHLYISYSHDLASSHTHNIKELLTLPSFRHTFDIELSRESRAKDFFRTTAGGAVAAFGSSGAITGRDAGLPGQNRYTGAVIMDDMHKPDEVHSDTIRERVKRNYLETIQMRCRSENVPIVFIGQRLHEDDLCNMLINGEDGHKWKHVSIEALDPAGNSRYPEVASREKLLSMKEHSPYVFWSQMQQQPIPAGGSLFKTEDFVLLDQMPHILSTFITADTAETEKTWNDKTVFSFWGLYKIKHGEVETAGFGLHWIDCVQLNIVPKNLQDEFLSFWSEFKNGDKNG